MCRSVTNLATTQDTVNDEPFLGTIKNNIYTHGKHNQWMIELLLNVKRFQVKIDTGVVGVTAISEEYSGNWMESL